MQKKRLDVTLVERGLAETRSQAQRLVMAGQVRVNAQLELRPATAIPAGAQITIDTGPAFVSRGGEKLQAALLTFPINPTGMVCADVGASTGGFTDCLLQHGAQRVYAIDVGQGILHWKLRQDARVVVMENTNARHLQSLPEKPGLVTVDASFISLKILLPVIRGWVGSDAYVIALIKPQFEAGRADVARGRGVIHDPAIHQKVLVEVLAAAQQLGFCVIQIIRSPLLGPKGNTEFLAFFSVQPIRQAEPTALVAQLFEPPGEAP